MFGTTYFHDITRKYVILFGTIFNQIYINRYNEDNESVQTIKVPITYASKDKMLTRIKADPELDRPYAITLPRMSFELVNLTYDGNRKMNTNSRFNVKTDANKNQRGMIYNSVPYNLNFNLYIYTKATEDTTRIVEQILPYFTPDWTQSIHIVPTMDATLDIPIVLDSVEPSDQIDGPIDERRVLIWTLSFTMKGYFFGPVKKQSVIKKTITNMYLVNVASDFDDVVGKIEPDTTITVVPGLDANGNPTSNSEITIPYGDITAEDDYGFIINIERKDE